MCMLYGHRILQKRNGHVKGNRRDISGKKNCYVRLLGEPYFRFKKRGIKRHMEKIEGI